MGGDVDDIGVQRCDVPVQCIVGLIAGSDLNGFIVLQYIQPAVHAGENIVQLPVCYES
ncbi:hypothetical protein D3C80_1751860 [compost metagenome]